MNYIRHLNAFFSFVRSDNRLTSSHVSLYVALFQYWNFNRFQNPFPVYRENLMQISKIGSKNTYHKCIRDLHQANYIRCNPAPSPFHPAKISMVRLDTKEEEINYEQLDLFSEKIAETQCPKIGTGSVPNLTALSPNIDTPIVPNLGHTIKQNNKQINGVGKTHTQIVEKNEEQPIPSGESQSPFLKGGGDPPLKGAARRAGGCPGDSPHLEGVARRAGGVRAGDFPTLPQVEQFFRKLNYPVTEAYKFFYYNQGKDWMLTDKLPITNWQALAHKWIINSREKKEQPMDLDKAIQYIYERFLEGERINKLILPEFADLLQLEITESIKHEALRRRLNQLSGSNENGHIQLWQAYMQEQWQDELVINDAPNLKALEQRLAVLKHFQKLKSKHQQNVFSSTG